MAERVLVTGGGGFLGAAICRQLLVRGDQVRSLARGDYPALRALGVETLRGDAADPATAERAVQGCDLVIHTAAKAGVWGDEVAYYRANVLATQAILGACRRQGVGRLVFTSSPSVVAGGLPLRGVDESVPYPVQHLAPYPRTKAIAERAVRAAHSNDLRTVSLRPHLILGPGDPHLVPRLIERARKGKLWLLGDGRNRVDVTYVEDAARAHLLAADALLRPGSPVGGRVYFLSQGQPVALAELLARILREAGLAKPSWTIPPEVGYAMGALMEGIYRVLPLPGEPPLTRFVAKELATDHYFDISAARRDLGYAPSVTVDELTRIVGASLSPPPNPS
ncbi:MAG: NAD-dependent epimerase/dehydratase family protein [Myxococcales bacterium]|nr:NAD-dependent epimerase/dehydratase family protein [Polyangiaceae bacterium]MDW8248727.1 NAD-dependent epimerase/dehydratase family protein [Myxococcales bacterium]